MVNKRWIALLGLFVFFAAGYYLYKDEKPSAYGAVESVEVSSNFTEGMVFKPGRQQLSIREINKITINNPSGNTFIKQAKQKGVSLDSEVISFEEGKDIPEYKVTRKQKELIIEVSSGEDTASLNLHVTVPTKVKDIDSKSVNGNIRGELIETNFIRFVTTFGNLLTEFDRVNQEGEYIFITNVGQIYTVVPDGTELSYVNQSMSGNTILQGVKENKQAVKFITTVRDVGWMPPQFVSKTIYEQLNNSTSEEIQVTNDQLQEDFERAVKLMKELHPHLKENPSRYDSTITEARQKVQKAQSREDLYFILKEIMVATKDGHTLVHLSKNRLGFPPIKWTDDGELVVIEEREQYRIGDKILTIGGKDDSFLKAAASMYISAEHEGNIKANITNFLSNPIHLKQLGMVNENGNVMVQVEREGQMKDITNTIESEHLALLDYYYKQQLTNPYHWSIENSGKYGIFTLEQCIPTEMYDHMVEEFFIELKEKNVPNLVIDLRNNGGGNSAVVNSFLSYLAANKGINTGVTIPEERLFKGNVYVLTSNHTFSAGTDFAALFKGYGLGKLVGEPPGNNASYGGNIAQFTLEHSGIYLQIPTTKHPAPVPTNQQDQPLVMDYPIQVTRDAIIAGQDLWIEKIKEIIRN